MATALPTVRREGARTFLSYRLRPEATWDNGKPVLARDVLFSLKLLNCPGLPNESQRSAFSFIQDVQLDTRDPRSFTFVCQGFTPEYVTASGDFPIMPPYLLDPDSLLRQVSLPQLTSGDSTIGLLPAVRAFAQTFNEPARWRDPRVLRGSGPYQLVSWQTGQRLTLERKPQWWADRLPNATPPLLARPRRVEFHIVPDNATASLALRRGDLDVYPNMPGPEFARLRREASGLFQFFTPASYRVVVLAINTRQSALRTAGTRQALSRLLDVDRLLKATQYGQGQRTVSLINPREKWVYQDSLPLISFSPAQAAQLLQQDGWRRTPAGWQRAGTAQPLQVRMAYAAGERTYETIALLFQQAAQQIGVPVTLQPTEPGLLSRQRRSGEFDLCLLTLYGNPFSYDLRPLLHTSSIGEGGVNHTRFGTAYSDRLLEAIVATEDSTSKARLLRKLQTLLYQESPLIPLFFEPNRLVVAKRLGSVRPSGVEPGYDIGSLQVNAAAER
ncbi:ABC transporter substrate-binding protein [Hymenobacter sp. CRA2]|uniref:ABC transporter substrate-binding protein n=1 Tax=Hymenobacter sp. CRA2 TaxID=1955620 RepID=UPI00158FB1DD|nr:ABC transporter substrate-binding protein [Hymenobacter sp. CRA2]